MSKMLHSHHSIEKQFNQLKSYNRKIQTSGYKKYPWITVCSLRFRVFCRLCCSAKQQGLLTNPLSLSPFISSGFANWKKALQKFSEHERSDTHQEAVEKIAIKSSTVHIGAQLSSVKATEMAFHRIMLLKVLSCVRYLGRQGLALWGHDESIESFDGNLYQLLLLEAAGDDKMKAWIDKKQYLSPVITNEIINIIGLTVLEKILTDIKTSKWYTIIVDEATDISHTEQMSLSIRWVNQKYQISEDTLGLIELLNTRAITIYQQIKDILIRCCLPLSQCRGQAYDGASNMSGIRNGVQALVKQEESKALYVHCLAHNLNLCLQDASKKMQNYTKYNGFYV